MRVKFTTPVTLIKRTLTDEQDSLGNDVYTDTPTPVDGGGVFAPGGSTEILQGQDTVVTQPTVFLPVLDLTAVDVLLVSGVRYEVDGDPKVWPVNAFTGWAPQYPLEVPLRKVTG